MAKVTLTLEDVDDNQEFPVNLKVAMEPPVSLDPTQMLTPTQEVAGMILEYIITTLQVQGINLPEEKEQLT